MRETPSRELIALLERLGLCGEGELRQMGGRVRRLARDLPVFESVWVDALAQARILTPFQAAEINGGRGELLRVGPYLLCSPLRSPHFAACYRARRVDSGQIVRLLVSAGAGERVEETRAALERLVAASAKLATEHVSAISEAGIDGAGIDGAGDDGDRVWAASPWVEGRTAGEWMAHNGRFPPEVAIEIARAMLAGLVALERAGLCHGDVGAAATMLTDAGGVVLLQPGLRAILRPEEGYARADLLPEAYDYLAPERITDGTPPTITGDVYACGCVWWHLLCGRPPLSGGDSLGKLRAAQAAKVFDVRRLAPEVPGPFGEAIEACLEREPSRRPESMARLAAMLGPPSRSGRRALSRCLVRHGRSARRPAAAARRSGRRGRSKRWLAATAGCLMAAAVTLWAVWGSALWNSGLPWERGREEAAGGELAGERVRRKGDEGRHSETADRWPRRITEDLDAEGTKTRMVDAAVVAATYETQRPAAVADRTTAEDLVLSSSGPLRLESLRLQAGQCVRGMPGERPLVVVPRTGLIVDADDVRFENIDFLWDHPPQTSEVTAGEAAIVDLRCGRAEFQGCSFRSVRRLSGAPVAVRWTHPVDRGESELLLPSGRVQLNRCVLRWVDVGVDCRTIGALAVELTNTLQLGGGPLVRLDHCPRADEPILIVLSQVTLRGGGPVLECGYARIEDRPGEISIRATGCALVPAPGSALLLLSGPDSPQRMLGSIRWTGQGSLVWPEAGIAAWRRPDGLQEPLDETAVSIDGLVRSEVEFSGNAESGAAGSRIVRWQAPLRSTDPPGVDPALLPGGDTARDGL